MVRLHSSVTKRASSTHQKYRGWRVRQCRCQASMLPPMLPANAAAPRPPPLPPGGVSIREMRSA